MRLFKFGAWFFLVAGIILLIAAPWHYMSTKRFLATSIKTEGVVVELIRHRDDEGDILFKPLIEFRDIEDKLFSFASSVSSSRPAYKVGDIVEVAYQQNEPERAKLLSFASLWSAVIIFALMGSVFTLMGSILLGIKPYGKKPNTKLAETGYPIQADIIAVERNDSYSVNGQHPYIILAQWQDKVTSKIHIFHSHHIWFDPTDYVNQQTITVYIEQNNPKKYYMDTGFLPELA